MRMEVDRRTERRVDQRERLRRGVMEWRDHQMPVADVEREALQQPRTFDDSEPRKVAHRALRTSTRAGGVDDALAARVSTRSVRELVAGGTREQVAPSDRAVRCRPRGDHDEVAT